MLKKTLLLAYLVGLLVTTSVSTAAEVYRWVDSNGKVQFSDQAVPGAEPVNVHTPAPADTSYIERLEKQKKLSEATAEEREQQAKTKAEQVAKAKEMETKCQEVKEQISILDRKRPVYTVNDKGERNYLSDEDRVAKAQEYNDLAAQLCK